MNRYISLSTVLEITVNDFDSVMFILNQLNACLLIGTKGELL